MRGAGRLAAASRAMEGNMHLLQLIRKMRSQIDELERENRALRGELRACGPGTTAARAGSLAGPTARPDPTPSPAAAASEQAGTVTPLLLPICGRGGEPAAVWLPSQRALASLSAHAHSPLACLLTP